MRGKITPVHFNEAMFRVENHCNHALVTQAAREKAETVINELTSEKLKKAAQIVREGIEKMRPPCPL